MEIVTLEKSGIDWAALYFTAECDREEYKDVRVVTAKSVYLERLQECALSVMDRKDVCNTISAKSIEQLIRTKLGSYFPEVYECVRFEAEQIVVVIDVDKVDDQAIETALEMVAMAICKNSTEVCFSKPLLFELDVLLHLQD